MTLLMRDRENLEQYVFIICSSSNRLIITVTLSSSLLLKKIYREFDNFAFFRSSRSSCLLHVLTVCSRKKTISGSSS